MRVLHQLNGLDIGGVETFVYRLCKYRQEETYILSHKDGIIGNQLRNLGIPTYILDTFENITELISRENIDIVLFHNGGSLPVYAKQLKERFPLVKFISVMHAVWKSENWVDKIICVSNAVLKENDPSKSVLIYPGIEYSSFNIGNVSRIAPYKFTQDLILIVKEILKQIPDVHLWLVGEEASDAVDYISKMKDFTKFLGIEGNVHFIRYQEDIPWELFDIYAHLVGDEAYPVTILEAVSHNIPTYTYERRGTGEMWHPLLFKSNDLIEMGNRIYTYIQSRPKHMRNVAKEFSEVYKNVMAQ